MNDQDTIRWKVFELRIIKKIRKYFSVNTDNEYHLEYVKGRIQEKIPGSFGLFCFRTERNARNFVKAIKSGNTNRKFIVKKVVVNNRLPDQELICNYGPMRAFYSRNYFSRRDVKETRLIPFGTEWYESVKII